MTFASAFTEKLRDRTESTLSKVAGDTQLGWSMQAILWNNMQEWIWMANSRDIQRLEKQAG